MMGRFDFILWTICASRYQLIVPERQERTRSKKTIDRLLDANPQLYNRFHAERTSTRFGSSPLTFPRASVCTPGCRKNALRCSRALTNRALLASPVLQSTVPSHEIRKCWQRRKCYLRSSGQAQSSCLIQEEGEKGEGKNE